MRNINHSHISTTERGCVCVCCKNNSLMSYVPISGPSHEGAGSGGRIAVYLTERFIFGGTLTALGGSSGNSKNGSPGTVYIDVDVGEEPFRMIQVDNNNRNSLLLVTLAETNTALYQFERIHLVRRGALAIKEVSKERVLLLI